MSQKILFGQLKNNLFFDKQLKWTWSCLQYSRKICLELIESLFHYVFNRVINQLQILNSINKVLRNSEIIHWKSNNEQISEIMMCQMALKKLKPLFEQNI
ncbi:hypothetical protein BpHYR1_017071 [Brachionus plicatilis]|uniref:Uncharacterized protein n=1 Tax=Brachionus plicatilis TaxID=10195 RepID=A0A3M7RQ23_BRAPC|nr:hypothetical protein BpHYR1_017071 [Brachionus plicatilis]